MIAIVYTIVSFAYKIVLFLRERTRGKQKINTVRNLDPVLNLGPSTIPQTYKYLKKKIKNKYPISNLYRQVPVYFIYAKYWLQNHGKTGSLMINKILIKSWAFFFLGDVGL